MTLWTIAALAHGAFMTMSAQLSLAERVSFECSASGLFVTAQLEETDDDAGSSLELLLSGESIKPKNFYMLETNPRTWSGAFPNELKVLTKLASSEAVGLTVAGRSVVVDLDRLKTQDFLKSCEDLSGDLQ